MKKLLILILSVCILLSFAGCSGLENILGGDLGGGQVILNPSGEDKGIKRVDCDTLDLTVEIDTEHRSLGTKEYYRFINLNETEQKVYLAIEKAVKIADISVDLTGLSINYERAMEIAQIFMADCPQYFYMSKYINATHYEGSEDAVELRLYYTDGKVTDSMEGEELTSQADRDIIEEQIEEFNDIVEEILEEIPVYYSDEEMVKAIHDYIVENTEYDEPAAALVDTDDMPPAYTAYGALCEGMAVCEGYAKAFQFLCYSLGINCAQVYGSGDGEPHMWNLVQIDDKWYHTDLTWDDPVGGDGRVYYDYYNLSWNEMKKDHVMDDNFLKLP